MATGRSKDERPRRDLIADAGSAEEGSASFGAGAAGMAAVWIALVAVGVLGRLWQPAYNVSPLLGVGVAAGAAIPNPLVALTVPVATLAASNLALPGGGSYGSWGMAIVVYAAFAWPVVLGPFVRRHRVWGPVAAALAGSLAFFLVTNFAHWAWGNDYPHSLAGLAECYVAALPFYRWMPAGDVAWSLGLVSGAGSLLSWAGRPRPETA